MFHFCSRCIVRKEIEEYKIQNYPELGKERRHTKEQKKEKTQSYKGKDKEYRQKYRTGEKSRNDEIKQIIASCFAISYTKEKFKKNLKAKGLELYEDSETRVGIIDLEAKEQGKKKHKHRFKTLGLFDYYSNFLEHIKAIKEFENEKENDEMELEDELER